MYDNTIPQATLPQNGYMQVPPQLSPPTQNVPPRIQQLMQRMRDSRGDNPPQDYWLGKIPRQGSIAPQPGPSPVMSPQMMQYLSRNFQNVFPRTPAPFQQQSNDLSAAAGAPGAQPVQPMQSLQGLGVSPNFQNRMNYLVNSPQPTSEIPSKQQKNPGIYGALNPPYATVSPY